MNEQGKISFIPAVLMTINVMIGVGIYFNPQLMAAQAGNCSFLGWIVVALILLPLIWVTALAARMFPGSGGFYNYGKSAICETVGFVAIWSYLIGYVGMVSGQIFALHGLVKGKFPANEIIGNQVLFNVIFIIALALFSMLSITWISRIQSFITVLKLLPFFCVIGLLYFYWDPQFTLGTCSYASIGSTFTFALFGYMGFESCTNISSFLKGGSQEAFKVVLTAFFIVVALYSLFHLGLLHIMGGTNLSTMGVPAFPLCLGIPSAVMLAWAQIMLGFVLIIGYSNAIYGNMLSNVTNLASAAEKKLVFGTSMFTRLNRFDRPTLAVIAQCFATFLVITFFPDITVVSAFANLSVVVTLVITTLSVFVTQIRQASYGASCISFLSFISCAIFIRAAWFDLGVTNCMRFTYLSILLGLIGLGLVMFKSLRCCKS